MIRRNFLKAICASPLALLAKKPKPQLKVDDLLKWKYEMSHLSALECSRMVADNGCPGLTNVEANPYPHERIWAEDDLTTSNTSPRHPNGYAYVVRNETLGDGQVISWMQIPGEARCYVEKS